MVARVSSQGKQPKLMSASTGPCNVAHDNKGHVYTLQHVVTAELPDVARMRFYADDQLEITGEVLDVVQQLENQEGTTSGASRLSSGLRAARCSL